MAATPMEQPSTEPADPGEKNHIQKSPEPSPLPPKSGKPLQSLVSPPKAQTNHTRKPAPPPPPKYSQLVAIQAKTSATSDKLTELHQPIPKPPKRKRQQKLSEELTLRELSQNYSKSFPLRIAVVCGYYDPYNRSTISNADMYNIHFLKHQKVVTIRDSHNCPYSIPLNSSVQFAIVYDPDNQQGGEMKPHTFQMAANIMAAEVLPKVVCVTKAFKGPNKTSSVEENEILIVRHVQKSKFRGKKALQVFSLCTRSEKLLPYECEGYFSTKPSLIKLYLPQIVQHLPGAFPCQAILFLGGDLASSKKYFPSGLRSNLITMTEAKTETSMIASTVINQTNATGREPESSLIDIPIDDAMSVVKVCVIEADDAEETEKLYDYTRNVFGKLDPSKLVSYKPRGSEEIYTTQSLFYATLLKGSEQIGIELHAPAAAVHQTEVVSHSAAGNEYEILPGEAHLYQTLDPLSKQRNQQYASLTQQPDRHRSMSASSATQVCSTRPRTRGSLPPIPSKHISLQPVVHEELDTLPGEVPSPQRMQMETELLKQSTNTSAPLGKGASRMVTNSTNTSGIYEIIPVNNVRTRGPLPPTPTNFTTADLENCSKPHSQNPQQAQHTESKREQSVEDNKVFLLSLSVTQVQNLLEAMSLTRYSDAFAAECISGEILAELDDETLQQELGVNSKIHRIRLMKVITGKHSAQNILAGLNPYAM